jgi:hypothetical protein
VFIVVSYYTVNSLYQDRAKVLAQSLSKFGLDYDLQPINNLGGWDKNTHYKPQFVKEMLDKHTGKAVVYTDADSEFLQYPKLFDELTCDIAAHLLDHSKFRRKKAAPELLSGTLYFGNTEKARQIVERWKTICDENPTMWDQAALQQALEGEVYYNLPSQYCTIYDYMSGVQDKVVIHYQASRQQRAIEKQRKV